MVEPQKEEFDGEIVDAEDVRDEELLFDDATDWGVTDLRTGQQKSRSISRPPKAQRRGIPGEGDMLAGKYRVERVASSNGMTGLVHARHEEAEQRVVLKFLLPEVCGFPDIVARFLRGARAALQIRSEHAARILDVGRFETGAPYFAMEFLRGWALSEVIRVRGPLPVPDAVDYVAQACEAVAEAHVLGFAHRNLNMSTVLLTRRPDTSPLIKVLDFGASDSLVVDPYGDEAPMLDQKSFLESLPYTSPEQIRSANDVDARADVWAIGTMLHELLAGSPLYRADTAPALMAMIVADPALPVSSMRPDVPPELEAVILRCVEKDRSARFANVAELALALRPFAADDGLPAIERISRMVGRSSRPPPLFSHSRALVRVPPPPARTRPALPPPPTAPGGRDRLIPIAIACAGVIGGAAVGAIVALKTSAPDLAAPAATLAAQAFAASPATATIQPQALPQAAVPQAAFPQAVNMAAVPATGAAPMAPAVAMAPPALAPNFPAAAAPAMPTPAVPEAAPQPVHPRSAPVSEPPRRREPAARTGSDPRAIDPEEQVKRMSPRQEDPFDDGRGPRVSQKAGEAPRVPPASGSKDLFDDVR